MSNNYMHYPTTVKILAGEIKTICDDYNKRKIDNAEIKETILWYAQTQSDKFFCDGEINPTISKIIGQKRVRLINVLLAKENGGVQ